MENCEVRSDRFSTWIERQVQQCLSAKSPIGYLKELRRRIIPDHLQPVQNGNVHVQQQFMSAFSLNKNFSREEKTVYAARKVIGELLGWRYAGYGSYEELEELDPFSEKVEKLLWYRSHLNDHVVLEHFLNNLDAPSIRRFFGFPQYITDRLPKIELEPQQVYGLYTDHYYMHDSESMRVRVYPSLEEMLPLHEKESSSPDEMDYFDPQLKNPALEIYQAFFGLEQITEAHTERENHLGFQIKAQEYYFRSALPTRDILKKGLSFLKQHEGIVNQEKR